MFLDDINKCIEVLKKGGLILYPTDTVWGIGCDATNESAVSKIYQLKQRIETKKMIVLMASEKEVIQHVTNLNLSVFDYIKTLSKPTTVIYEGVIGLADNILGEDGSVGIRICEEAFCKHLIKEFQKPIVSTSANVSGQTTPSFYSEIDTVILNGVDYIVQYRRYDNLPKEPSSVIQWNNNGEIEIIRK